MFIVHDVIVQCIIFEDDNFTFCVAFVPNSPSNVITVCGL